MRYRIKENIRFNNMEYDNVMKSGPIQEWIQI